MSLRFTRATAVLALVLLVNMNTFAWGPEGHRIVALLAQQRLTPAAKAQVRSLLGSRGLAAVANYADQIRPSRPETANWHFVDIPLNEAAYDEARDCKATDHGDCVIAELARARADALNTRLSKAKRAEALKFIVHFVGDIHQPLHCTDNNDRGGNQVNVDWFGQSSNLHRVWDSNIITETHLAEADYVDQLNGWLDSQDEKALAQGTTTDWAQEAHKQAHDHSYVNVPGGGLVPNNANLGSDYFDANEPVVDQQLAPPACAWPSSSTTCFPDQLRTKPLTPPTARTVNSRATGEAVLSVSPAVSVPEGQKSAPGC